VDVKRWRFYQLPVFILLWTLRIQGETPRISSKSSRYFGYCKLISSIKNLRKIKILSVMIFLSH